MKSKIVFALFVAMTLMSNMNVFAQTLPQAHYRTIQYSAPPVPIRGLCNVNGVAYPVDFNSQIWGRNAYSQWFVIGQIQATTAGYIAVRSDGVTFPAFCQ